MEWICEGCNKHYSEKVFACDPCIKSRPDDVVFVENEQTKLFSEQEPLGRIQRIFSFKNRITRLDYLLSFFGMFLIMVVGVGFSMAFELGDTSIYISILIYGIAFLMGSKRCRDLEYEPWLTLPLTIFTFGAIMFLFIKGTEGANKYGPANK